MFDLINEEVIVPVIRTPCAPLLNSGTTDDGWNMKYVAIRDIQ
jgi:hypothetical protein